jgi:flagellar basal-body rod protein FlgB
MKLFDETKIPILSKALDAYVMRHRAISSNIANIGTVGYRSQGVSFEEQLNGALGSASTGTTTTQANHMHAALGPLDQTSPVLVDTPQDEEGGVDPTASGVNDVDIDREMTELAKNQLRFKFASRMLGDSFRALQKSIRGTV